MGSRDRDRTGDVRRVVATHLPGAPVGTVVPAGAGLDNLADEVDGTLIVRFSREPDPARRAARCRRWPGVWTLLASLSVGSDRPSR